MGSLLKPLLVAVWFAALFLPFRGVSDSFILSVIVFLGLVILTYAGTWTDIFCTGRLKTARTFFSGKLVSAVIPLQFVFLGLLLSMPFFLPDYFLDVSILTGIYVILALGLNVIVGFTGLLNLGFAAFYAIGAYSYALLNTKMGLDFWLALPVCVGLTTFSGFVLAIPALRLRGDYLAIVTLGFGEIVRLVLNNWDSFTGGPNGISGIQQPFILGADFGVLNRYYYIVLAAVVISYLVIGRVKDSGIGRAWIAIREDEIAASSMGVSLMHYKLFSVAFGSLWAGLSGALFAAKMRFISPESFTFMESVLILAMVILGGIGSIPGAVIGACILVMLPEALRGADMYRMLILGAGLIVLMVFRPQGLLGVQKGEG